MKTSNAILLTLAILIIVGIAGLFYVTTFKELFSTQNAISQNQNTPSNYILNGDENDSADTTTDNMKIEEENTTTQQQQNTTTTSETTTEQDDSEISLAQEDAEKIAERWVRNKSEVFQKDGENLKVVRSVKMPNCEKCYIVALRFDSKTHSESATSGVEAIEAHLSIVEIRDGMIERANTLGVKDASKFDQIMQQGIEQTAN